MQLAAKLSPDEITDILGDAVQNTLESLYFAETAPLPTTEMKRIHGADGLNVDIDLKGPFAGHISMYLSMETARWLSTQGTSVPSPITDEVLADALSEVLNTIAGRVAATISQAAYSFDLSIPEVTFGRISMAETAQIKTCYRLEYGCICFTFIPA